MLRRILKLIEELNAWKLKQKKSWKKEKRKNKELLTLRRIQKLIEKKYGKPKNIKKKS